MCVFTFPHLSLREKVVQLYFVSHETNDSFLYGV